jgi:hypothetical protein
VHRSVSCLFSSKGARSSPSTRSLSRELGWSYRWWGYGLGSLPLFNVSKRRQCHNPLGINSSRKWAERVRPSKKDLGAKEHVRLKKDKKGEWCWKTNAKLVWPTPPVFFYELGLNLEIGLIYKAWKSRGLSARKPVNPHWRHLSVTQIGTCRCIGYTEWRIIPIIKPYLQIAWERNSFVMSTTTVSVDQNVDPETPATTAQAQQKRARIQLSCTSCRHAKYVGSISLIAFKRIMESCWSAIYDCDF